MMGLHTSLAKASVIVKPIQGVVYHIVCHTLVLLMEYIDRTNTAFMNVNCYENAPHHSLRTPPGRTWTGPLPFNGQPAPN